MGVSIRERMQTDLVAAMTARDEARTSVLRSALAAIANAEAVDEAEVPHGAMEVPRKLLTEDVIRAIVIAEHDELRSASSEMTSLGQAGKANELAAQAAALSSYLS